MKRLMIVLAHLSVCILLAQSWSQPINVSNQQNIKSKLDFCIDSRGIIHCIWMNGNPIGYQIYYSRSIDGGLTWTTPLQISDIDAYTRYYPKIVADSSGRLFVTYTCTYEGTETIRLKRYNGRVWTPEQTISASQVNSINLALAIDNCDRVYSFWQVYENPIGYKFNYVVICEDNISQIFSPYSSTLGNNLIYSVVADSIGNLHCSGARRETPNSVVNACYYRYNISDREWLAPVSMLNQYDAYQNGSDISLNRQGLPLMTWREVLNPNYPLNDRSQFSQFNGQVWSNPITISEDPWYQTMVVDANNIVHLVQVEKFYIGPRQIKNLVYYTSDGWEGEIITNSTNIATFPELRLYNNTLYLVYLDSISASVADIYFMKRVLPDTSINDELNIDPTIISSLSANPNPFRESVEINYKLNSGGPVNLGIFNIRGQLVKTLSKEYKNPGTYTVLWDGSNEHGNSVSNGIYYCRIQVDNKIKTIKLLLVK